MDILLDSYLPDAAVRFLKRCYLFTNSEWQHIDREATGDRGFEMRFRESCMTNLSSWIISQEREMRLGEDYETASGVLHEVDIVVQTSDLIAVVEMKNRPATPPDKTDVIIFFAKILDYLAHNPLLLTREVLPAFISSTSFDESGLATCLGLGIHPIAPGLRPVPVLADSALRMKAEIRNGTPLASKTVDQFDEFCIRLNRLSFDLRETWLTNRCGFLSEDAIIVRAIESIQSLALSRQIRQLNGDCSELLAEFKDVKARSRR